MHWRRGSSGGGNGRVVGSGGLVALVAVMAAVVGSSLAQNIGLFRLTGIDKKFADPMSSSSTTLVLSSWPSSLIVCAADCNRKENCVALNYHRVERTCEHLGSAWLEHDDPALQDHPGWNYYTQHYPNLPSVVDPCGSNPCQADSVCVRYLQPIHQKYRYDLDFYMCTRHQWYLDERNAGRTACKHNIVYDLDYLPSNMVGYQSVYAPLQDTFRQCLSHGCGAVLCFDVNTNVRCWFKSAFHDIETRAVVTKGFVFWYPECQ